MLQLCAADDLRAGGEQGAAGRKRIIEATKKRWAEFRAAMQANKPAITEKSAAKNAAVRVATKTAVKKPLKKAAKAPEQAATGGR